MAMGPTFIIRQEKNTKANGRKGREMDMELYFMLIMINISGNSKMVRNTEMESFFSRKEYINSKVRLLRTKRTETAGLPFKMEIFLKAFS